jgi:NAD+ synthase
MKNLANEIVAWLKDYATKYNRKTFVVGVSGRIDSGLVSTLCAMTGISTACVTLPCHSRADGLENADKHIKWIKGKFPNVYSLNVDLTFPFEAFKKSFNGTYDSPLGWANTKSRLRMIALYQIATPSQGLVIGTGNKVEDFGVGFFTKYGDGGVDISPIADLTKTEVRQMARELGVIPDVTEAVPTDGLWADTRSDESQLGASYEELESIMNYLETHSSNDVGTLTNRQKEVLVIYNKWHEAGAHKLKPIPTFKKYK